MGRNMGLLFLRRSGGGADDPEVMRPMMKSGAYEQVVNRDMDRELKKVPGDCMSEASLDAAEAPQVLTRYVSQVTERALEMLQDDADGLARQTRLVNSIVSLISSSTGEPEFEGMQVEPEREPRQLLALLSTEDLTRSGMKKASQLTRPETSLSRSSLFTGDRREPTLLSELCREAATADRIDMLVSFIKWSGLVQLRPALERFTEAGGRLRVITTTYMGATDLKAVTELAKLPNTEVRISYNTQETRLHAKSYVFYRESGFSTAYVGSSNMSGTAMSTGTEWNLKITAQDQPEILEKIQAVFDSYMHDEEFELYTAAEEERLAKALDAEREHGGPGGQYLTLFDIRPYPFQQQILDRLQAEREIRHRMHNLVVAATGTGKTMIAAFDYRRCREKAGRDLKLLFVAHREEILRQSMSTFQAVLKDPNFGDLFTGKSRPSSFSHLFLSIQTFASQSLQHRIPAEYYDYIVVDEFHHAAAPSYRKLLEHFQPGILLGLTATPERLDGKNILEWFGNRIAAEIRLPEAIERHLLCPFQYFGVSDTVDLNELKWSRGGYDRSELDRVYLFNRAVAERRAAHIISSLGRYVADLNKVKGLGFCVSVDHAAFMAEQFNAAGIRSAALTGQSGEEERRTAAARLISGELKFIFVVDIYNEGVDIPQINTVLFLRPTESLTVFLQQLGRGLRLWEGKECLTVLDFIGQANRKYRFEEKFAALLAVPGRSVKREIENGFPSVPTGCCVQLEKKAMKNVLDNIKAATGRESGLIARIASFTEDTGLPLTLANFLDSTCMDVRELYNGKRTFSRLCAAARVRGDFQEPAEEVLTKVMPRMACIDSRRWIGFLQGFLKNIGTADPAALTEEEQRMFRMFYVSVWGDKAWDADTVKQNLAALAASPVMVEELQQLLDYQFREIDFVDEPVNLGFACPLDLYCTYTRDQILTAMDFVSPTSVREGVKWLPDRKVDVFFVTLNKSDREYSPTTMYNDYSISRDLFHWQSQSTTSESSRTGQRYIHHAEQGSRVILFVRESKKDRFGPAPYTCLGTVTYAGHTGSRPMSILWKMDRPIPVKYLQKTGRAAAG